MSKDQTTGRSYSIAEIGVADHPLHVARQAANALEKLAYANQSMRSAAQGILPDGTPVEDMLNELREGKAEIARLHNVLRQIRYHANCKASERAEAMARIKEVLDAM